MTRALAVMRMRSGKKVPPYLQRFQADDLLASCFPEQVGCLENHHGAVAIPDHPLVRQTMHDCLHEATDVDGWCALLERVSTGEVQLIARETREPSPFSHELLNANPYAFLDPAPLEERRTRAVSARRTLSVAEMQDMGRLDPAAIGHVRSEAWPLVRDAEELHDALMGMVLLPEADAGDWAQFFQQLVTDGRAAVAIIGPQVRAWIAAERLPLVRALFPGIADRTSAAAARGIAVQLGANCRAGRARSRADIRSRPGSHGWPGQAVAARSRQNRRGAGGT